MIKVLDTNIILLDAYNIVTLGNDGSTVVIPATVVDEIDSKKAGTSEIAYQAREFGRLLSKGVQISIDSTRSEIFSTTYLIDGTKVQIVTPKEYPDFLEIEPNIYRDRQIIYTATLFPDCTFITNDVMCRLRAIAEGLTAIDHKVIADLALTFNKELTVSSEVFSDLHRLPIADVNADHQQSMYNYTFTDETSGQTKLATISNGLIHILGKDTEKDLRKQDLNPLNSGQLFFSKAIQDPAVNIVVCEALAGSGKTAVALSNAIKLVRTAAYDSILYIRASVDDVDKSEEIGFLSGNDEKMQVYLHPLEDTLDFIVRNRFKDSKVKGPELEVKIVEEVEKMRARFNIQSIIGLGMRGRTFRNAVVIIDEVQNQSKASLQKMLTRFTDSCKLIIIGSNKQIDNAYLTKYTNGLSTLLDACTKPQDKVKLHAVSLPKVVRGNIAEFAENLFTKGK